MPTRDWVRQLPVISLMMNSQESSATGYSPHELFLGRPAWFLHAPYPDDTHSSVGEWVQEQQAKVDKAKAMLQRVRERQWNKKNKHRVPATYQEGDSVLVHHSRLPAWPRTTGDDPYFGPYKILSMDGHCITVRHPASHKRRHQGMGSTQGLAHLHTHSPHPSGTTPLWGRHRGRGESGLHQALRPPPSPHDAHPLTGSSRSRHHPPPSRTTGPHHMPTLDTPPDRHAHQHQHMPVEPPAASTPFPAPRHTHQPYMPGGRTPGGPLRQLPPSPQRHHRHHRVGR